jgi:hypothetical protein
MKAWQRKWNAYKFSGSNEFHSEQEVRRIIFINSFSVIGVICLSIFGFGHSTLNPRIGITELTFAVIFILNLIALRIHQKPATAARIALSVSLAILIFLLYTGGIANTGIAWFYTFPAIAFFLTGIKGGCKWIAALITLTLLATYGMYLGFTPIAYEYIVIRQTIASLLAVSFLIYFYQNTQEIAEKRILDDNRALKNAYVHIRKKHNESISEIT